MTDRERAMKKVQMYNFALIDAHLFLDSHPNDKQALDYFKRHKKMYADAAAEYVKRFGPLRPGDISDNATKWDWVTGPWPWEGDK